MLPFLHRAAPHTVEDNPLWLVVLADMMTNLMLFFLVMFSMTLQGEAAKQELLHGLNDRNLVRAPAPRPEKAEREFKEEETAAQLRRLFGDVRITEDAIRVSLRDRLIFRTADASIAEDGDRTLGTLALVLAQLPNTVIVEGHTDNVPVVSGPYRSNWELSVARSNAVIERLAARAVEPGRLVAAGYGEHLPAAANDTPEGRARNRRVEIVILRDTPPEKT